MQKNFNSFKNRKVKSKEKKEDSKSPPRQQSPLGEQPVPEKSQSPLARVAEMPPKKPNRAHIDDDSDQEMLQTCKSIAI